MLDHLLESSRRDDSKMCTNIEFCEEMGMIEMKIYTLSGFLLTELLTTMHAIRHDLVL